MTAAFGIGVTAIVLVESLEKIGITDRSGHLIHGLVQQSATTAAWVSDTALAFGCNLTNNLPTGLVAGRGRYELERRCIIFNFLNWLLESRQSAVLTERRCIIDRPARASSASRAGHWGESRMPSGFRILPRQRAVSRETIERFAKLPVANVSDSMSRLTAGGARLRPMHAGGVMAGPALTVKSAPGDNLMAHKAIALAQPGDIIVVDAGGDLTNAIIGELMLQQMKKRNLGGVVINGAIRDSGAIRSQHFPVFAAGITHRGPYKNGPGEINVPIAIDGMVIAPGDLVLGDDDGLLCVPFDDLDAVLAAASAKFEAEQKQMANIEAGTHSAAWVDESLRKLGCEGIT